MRDPIARTLSQFEHHISRDRFFEKGRAAASSSNDTTVPLLETVEEAQRRRSRTLLDLVSPQRCPQTDRRSAAQCAALTNPRKCRANGWCGIFQNHQTESLAGAMSLKPQQSQRLRRSGDQLLCTAKAALRNSDGKGLSFVGLTEHHHASVCLLMHAFKLGGSYFGQCCEAEDGPGKGANCKLLAMQTTANSANERAAAHGKKVGRRRLGYAARTLKASKNGKKAESNAAPAEN